MHQVKLTIFVVIAVIFTAGSTSEAKCDCPKPECVCKFSFGCNDGCQAKGKAPPKCCATNKDCPDRESPICKGLNCERCDNNTDCLRAGLLPFCSPHGTCDACVNHTNCEDPTKPICDKDNLELPICVPCSSNSSCVEAGLAPVCGQNGSCGDCKCSPNGVDLVFVIDASDSVGENNFKTMLQFAKQLVANLFERGQGVIKVAANTYSTVAKLQFKLNQHQGLERIQAAIDQIPFDARETNLQLGLENVLSDIVGERNGDRANAENLIVILADGDSNNDPLTPARKLISLNNLIVAVGIGKEVDVANLETITGRSDLVFKVDQFDELTNLVDTIANRQCYGQCPENYRNFVDVYGDVVFKSNSLPILGEFKTCQHCD